jgi:hypothetical protein
MFLVPANRSCGRGAEESHNFPRTKVERSGGSEEYRWISRLGARQSESEGSHEPREGVSQLVLVLLLLSLIPPTHAVVGVTEGSPLSLSHLQLSCNAVYGTYHWVKCAVRMRQEEARTRLGGQEAPWEILALTLKSPRKRARWWS